MEDTSGLRVFGEHNTPPGPAVFQIKWQGVFVLEVIGALCAFCVCRMESAAAKQLGVLI